MEYQLAKLLFEAHGLRPNDANPPCLTFEQYTSLIHDTPAGCVAFIMDCFMITGEYDDVSCEASSFMLTINSWDELEEACIAPSADEVKDIVSNYTGTNWEIL